MFSDSISYNSQLRCTFNGNSCSVIVELTHIFKYQFTFRGKNASRWLRYLQETPVLLNEKPPDIVIDGLLVSLSPPVGIADQVFDGFGLFPVLVQLQHPALQQNADGRGALK